MLSLKQLAKRHLVRMSATFYWAQMLEASTAWLVLYMQLGCARCLQCWEKFIPGNIYISYVWCVWVTNSWD